MLGTATKDGSITLLGPKTRVPDGSLVHYTNTDSRRPTKTRDADPKTRAASFLFPFPFVIFAAVLSDVLPDSIAAPRSES